MMRPSRDICETCHWPQKFYEDRVHEVVRFEEDEANTEKRSYLLMNTGGPRNDSESPAIHWHISSEVFYIPSDEHATAIPWVAVADKEGNLTSYMSTETPLSTEQVKEVDMVRADCVLCHNRATHAFSLPQEAMDEMLAKGRIDASLPFIKKKGVELLTASYQGEAEAMTGLAALEDYYREEYPDVFSTKKDAIRDAVSAIQEIYAANVFPKMNITWGTYPDYLGHEGCFRCHEGKHVTDDGRTISNGCDSCHQEITGLINGE
jgi:formate-dependent nitrite reductase cytochrome c552 subunit